MPSNPNSQFHIPDNTYSLNDHSNYGGFEYTTDQSYPVINTFDNLTNPQTKAEIEKDAIVNRLNIIGAEIESFREEEIRRKPTRHARDINVFVNDISKLFFRHNSSNVSYEITKRNELISKESVIGAKIFGLSNTATERADFFYEGRDENGIEHWFFYQDKIDQLGNHNSRTLHYEVSSAGILLVKSGYLKDQERSKFVLATEMYRTRVKDQLYSINEADKEKLSKSNHTIGRIISYPIRKISNRGNGQIAA